MILPEIVQVAVEQTAFHFDKLYSYLWPESLGTPQRGCRVLVPFGGGNRRRQAVVMACGQSDAAPDRLKPILRRLDEEPLFTEEMLELALWMKERTFCTVFEALQAMLPPGLYLKVRPLYAPADPAGEADVSSLTEEERQVLAAAREHPDGMTREAMLKQAGLSADHPAPERLLKKGWFVRVEETSRLHGDATIRMVRPAREAEEDISSVKLSEKQKQVMTLLQEVGCASVKELCYFCSVTVSVVTALQKKGLVVCYDAEVLRSPVSGEEAPPLTPTVLNEEQERAYEGLRGLLCSGKPAAALLYGVTGSGKTQVYMNLIDETLRQGRQALVLVPEISLTPQLLSIFVRRYGRRVAVLHSGLSIGERMDEWKRIRRGEASIAVGTRSAVFAPFTRLGLLVMDEEQEHTYKSESNPRYHAREVAKYRCAAQGALLLLTSATPSVESYQAAMTGRYIFCKLENRFGDGGLPQVEIADLRGETLADNSIGEKLLTEMHETLDAGKQVILLLNRRGFHTHVSCRSCGYVFTCPSCSISMTYHRANRQMICHYCGHMEPPPRVCPTCGSDKIRFAGLGTQRVEEELAEKFPDVPVLRMDADTTMSRLSYEKKFSDFAAGKYRIMIGTQMVAKGLDFPEVGLVGVLSADQSLYTADYRAFETTFALLTQVVGRAGRRDAVGKAVIQTYVPDNPVIALAARQDYPAFFENEIAVRKMMHYPPYADLCLFGFVGVSERAVAEVANAFLRELHTLSVGTFADVPLIALDPTPATVVRVAGKYRYRLIVKTKNSSRFRAMAATLLEMFPKSPVCKGVTVYADINPVTLL